MEFSKLKLEIYDLLGTLVPGILCIALAGLTIGGGTTAAPAFLGKITGTQLTLLLFAAFAAGQLVQEAADRLIKVVKGPRFLKVGRDTFWTSPAASAVREKIKRESGTDIRSADVGYDYCLTVIGDRFAKRDTFIAIADLARSLWFLAWVALAPLVRLSANLGWSWVRAKTIAEGLLAICIISYLAWARMIRFRTLSDVSVFHVFLAVNATADTPAPVKNDDTGNE